MSKLKNSKYKLVVQEMPTDPRFINRTGMRYGRLTVTGYAGKQGAAHAWSCNCDCGGCTLVLGTNLVKGATSSCGCRRKEVAKEKATTHGGSGSLLHRLWKNIRGRCGNGQHPDYARYGARGIAVGTEFECYEDFEKYVSSTLGPRPTEQHSLDRADNNKGYEPGNLRWATKSEQARNRRSNRVITLCGESVTMVEACEIFSLPYPLVMQRLNRYNWSMADAFSTPVGKKRPSPTINPGV